MGTQRGFHGRRTGASARRVKAWTQGPNIVNLSGSSSESLLWSNSIILTSESKVTWLRIRGLFSIQQTVATAINDGFFGAVAIGVASTAAIAAGVGSVPTPITEMDYDWMWHQFFDIRQITSTEGDGANSKVSSFRVDIDSKSMRKMGPSQSMFGVIELVEQGTASWFAEADTRVLGLLS